MRVPSWLLAEGTPLLEHLELTATLLRTIRDERGAGIESDVRAALAWLDALLGEHVPAEAA